MKSTAPEATKTEETDEQSSWFSSKQRHLALLDLPLKVTSWDVFLAYKGATELKIAGQLVRYSGRKWAIIAQEKGVNSVKTDKKRGRPKQQYSLRKEVLLLGGKTREIEIASPLPSATRPSKERASTQEKRPESGPEPELSFD